MLVFFVSVLLIKEVNWRSTVAFWTREGLLSLNPPLGDFRGENYALLDADVSMKQRTSYSRPDWAIV